MTEADILSVYKQQEFSCDLVEDIAWGYGVLHKNGHEDTVLKVPKTIEPNDVGHVLELIFIPISNGIECKVNLIDPSLTYAEIYECLKRARSFIRQGIEALIKSNAITLH